MTNWTAGKVLQEFVRRVTFSILLFLMCLWSLLQVEPAVRAPAEEDSGQKGAHRLPG